MSGEVIGEMKARGSEQGGFEGIVRSQLRGGHEHGSKTVGPHASEQGSPAFFADHAYEPVDGVLVPSSLRGRKCSVVLHPYVEDVGGIPGDSTQPARDGCHGDQGRESRSLLAREILFEFLVHAETRGAISYCCYC